MNAIIKNIINSTFYIDNSKSIKFRFTDSDLEERFSTYEMMQTFAKANYRKEFWNDIHFGSFLYNSYNECDECYDVRPVTGSDDFSIQEMITETLSDLLPSCVFLYEGVQEVIVSNKSLGDDLLGIFTSVSDAEREIEENYLGYHYSLDKDLVNDSTYSWDGDDYEDHIVDYSKKHI